MTTNYYDDVYHNLLYRFCNNDCYRIKTSSVADYYNISNAAAERVLKKLAAEKEIIKVGSCKYQNYENSYYKYDTVYEKN